jgi:demethylmenaquinone methyltransferase/2-methoxy-6-polyprenyl-1,4-benzoquinol methylase
MTSAVPPIDAGAATTVETAAETAAETTTSSPSRRPEKEKKFITGRPDEQYSSAAAEERQELFNDIAPVYDQLNDVLSLGLHRVWKRAAVKWTGVKKGDRAIDVCCGSGDLALRLADAVGPSGEVVGLDFAAAQLKVAATKETEHPAGYNLSPISWQQGDALALPHPDASFDGATIGYGLRNVSDIPRALAELRRVLKPGGKAAVVDFNNSTNAAVNQVQGFILDTVVVPAADALGVAAEYRYLKPSIERYPTGPELVDIAIAAGFGKATFYELAPGGLMGCLVCEK